MFIYWLFFAFPALMVLTSSASGTRQRSNAAQSIALLFFMLFYVLLATLRHEIGSDWVPYWDIHDDIRTDTFVHAITVTEPLFGVLNWISAKLGTGVYFVNGACAAILVTGVVRVATRMRDPWLALTMAVPYLLIVVGLGYVRQTAAIGMVLIAIATFDQARQTRTLLYLLLAVGFHSSAVVALPLFAYAIAVRHKFMLVLFSLAGAVLWFTVLQSRLAVYEVGYLDAEYESAGALTRLLMNVIPSILLLLRWKHFGASARVRSVWISIAIANLAAMVALLLTPSSTAVDRVALFFSIIQMAVFGEIRDLVPVGNKGVLFLKIGLILIAGTVQVIWLVFASNAEFWVPYQSIFETF